MRVETNDRQRKMYNEYTFEYPYVRIAKGRKKMQTRIHELRKERKITQNELADALDVTRQTIISLENGKYKASLVLAHKIAQFFKLSIEDIFIFDLEEENYDNEK